MKRIISFFFAILLSTVPLSAQVTHLPRDPEKLVTRAQSYWTYVVSGQKTKALDFVLPDKREAFLAATNAPVLDAKVEGLNLTEDTQHASVRVQMHLIGGVMGKDFQEWTQHWVWKTNNWYLDVGEGIGALMMPSGDDKAKPLAEIKKSIDQQLTLPEPSVNIGTVTQGQNVTVTVPITYSGDKPLAVELAAPNPSFSVNVGRGGLTSESKRLSLLFDTSEWENAVSLPVRLRFSYQGAFVERVITVEGNVFVPISFRQVPAEAKPGEPFSVFIRNNTTDSITLQSLSTEDRVDVLKIPETLTIGPNQESEVVLRLKPGETLNVLYLVPKSPVHGLGQFSYRIRTGR